MINPDYQRRNGLLLHNEGIYVWSVGDPLGHLFVLPCPVMKVNGKLQRPNSGRVGKGTTPSRIKVWVTPPGKEPRLAEVLEKSEDNTRWVIEEGNYNHQLRSCDPLQKKELQETLVFRSYFVKNMYIYIYIELVFAFFSSVYFYYVTSIEITLVIKYCKSSYRIWKKKHSLRGLSTDSKTYNPFQILGGIARSY